MLKHIVIILAVICICSVAFMRDAKAGPPWPAEVIQIREGDFCYFPWLDDNLAGVTLTGTGIWVAQYKNGHIQWNCHTKLDFSDPNIASLDQVCEFTDIQNGLDICNGNGSFFWTEAYEPAPFGCADEVNGIIYYSDAAHMVVTHNGNVNISCHYDIIP